MTAPRLQRRRLHLWTLPFKQVGELVELLMAQAHAVRDLEHHFALHAPCQQPATCDARYCLKA